TQADDRLVRKAVKRTGKEKEEAMTGRTRFSLGIAALAAVALAAPASAQSDGPRHLSPGSVLIFPLFDKTPGFNTIITVTNINTNQVLHDNDFRGGDVLVHYTYVDGDTWLESDVDEFLTPKDTLSVLVSEHDFGAADKGWLWVEARDPEFPDRPIDFDFLI